MPDSVDMERTPLRNKLNIIIFGHETPAGRLFDIALLWAILLSVLAVNLESVQSIESEYGEALRIAEWVFTVLFTIEYFLRLYCAKRSIGYAFSFFGIIDLLAVIPTYLSLVLSGSQYLAVIRGLRLLRVFRVLKMTRYLGEADTLMKALAASRQKIIVFLGTVLIMAAIVGALIHLIEGPENGFTSVPKSMYWAVVTLTTVGYGDIAPQTVLGQTLATIVMILGYGIIAVPTGIVGAEIAKQAIEDEREDVREKAEKLEEDAKFCKHCGKKI